MFLILSLTMVVTLLGATALALQSEAERAPIKIRTKETPRR